jgi:hypothetical protein
LAPLIISGCNQNSLSIDSTDNQFVDVIRMFSSATINGSIDRNLIVSSVMMTKSFMTSSVISASVVSALASAMPHQIAVTY